VHSPSSAPSPDNSADTTTATTPTIAGQGISAGKMEYHYGIPVVGSVARARGYWRGLRLETMRTHLLADMARVPERDSGECTSIALPPEFSPFGE
jgi:hypothetical protein